MLLGHALANEQLRVRLWSKVAWRSLVEGDEGCIGPSVKLMF